MPKLKILYKYLIENNIHNLEGWHDSYRNFCDEVDKARKKIKDENLNLIHGDKFSSFADGRACGVIMQFSIHDEVA